ncbi:DUF2306 domain-containing protein [Simiduia agarivorans]|uniref:DUF2306 domain-containing protein n=1 Tax=Simiduia agarivorans (strain DSM 21679 / JCM 13881 / BCRC 17597 / SA1) TaxID=1117647 RepID=R9S4Y3_SIMAS|nr:DUF2306 domain-containing protein [Simiduia agarivorans]AGN11295.1 hypothetical protein M5M_05787 [Simiduia agarivorans SA1 = DSM 21679]
MRSLAIHSRGLPHIQPQRLVNHAVNIWFGLALIGHWLFLAYLLVVFFPPIAADGMEGLKGMHLPSGFREGDFWGNLAATSHVLLAAIIIGGGPLQLMPAVRNRFPRFHRLLGRAYLLSAVTSAIGGLYITWTRSPIGDVISKLGISGDAVLIIVCAFMAVRHAMAGRFTEHRRWAMRLFLVASAVWFFRVGLMGWVLLTGGAGIDFETFTGPFLYVLGFAQYLLPLAMLEWYLHCQRSRQAWQAWSFALVLALLTLYMGAGIFAATMGMWLPRMS